MLILGYWSPVGCFLRVSILSDVSSAFLCSISKVPISYDSSAQKLNVSVRPMRAHILLDFGQILTSFGIRSVYFGCILQDQRQWVQKYLHLGSRQFSHCKALNELILRLLDDNRLLAAA